MTEFAWSSERIEEAVEPQARLGPRLRYSGISTDTRTLRPGELFVALRGERFDAVEFAGAAVRAGAPGLVVERLPSDGVPDEVELFQVDDSIAALGRLASYRRRALRPNVVAITGTSGKTTTKALVGAALGPAAYTSPGNLNNLVGVPLSMLAAPKEVSIWVLELASNQPGEISRLGQIVEPEHAIITSVSEGHLEGLGDLTGVLEEKLSLLDKMRPDGHAIVAAQPEMLAAAARQRHGVVVSVGLGEGADERPTSWRSTPAGVEWRWSGADFRLPVFGAHMVRNGLIAGVVARVLGVSATTAAGRLARVELPPMRGEIRRLNGMTLLIDCYNANPASFRAALDALAELAADRRRVVVAGSMLELGPASADLHRKVAGWMVDGGIELVGAIGAFAPAFAALTDEGDTEVVRADGLDEAYAQLKRRLRGDETVLIKASRGMRFERVVELLERDFGSGGHGEVSEATGRRG